MRRKRYLKQEHKKAMIAMDDFLVTYGAQKLGANAKNLAQRIFKAGQRDLHGLDELFHDQGFGRKHKYYEIAEGFICDIYDIQLPEAQSKAQQLTKDAFKYLGNHAKAFNHWKQA